MTPPENPTASETLERITEGARTLILSTLERLRDAETAVQEGRFREAYHRIQEAAGRVGPLAQAEDGIASVSASYIVRASDIEEGMVLSTWGKVVACERVDIPNPGGPQHTHIRLTVEEPPDPDDPTIELHEAQEVAVLRGD